MKVPPRGGGGGKLESVIPNKTFLKDVPKVSDEHETSFVEVLHKVDIYFAPKHTHFFFTKEWKHVSLLSTVI